MCIYIIMLVAVDDYDNGDDTSLKNDDDDDNDDDDAKLVRTNGECPSRLSKNICLRSLITIS